MNWHFGRVEYLEIKCQVGFCDRASYISCVTNFWAFHSIFVEIFPCEAQCRAHGLTRHQLLRLKTASEPILDLPFAREAAVQWPDIIPSPASDMFFWLPRTPQPALLFRQPPRLQHSQLCCIIVWHIGFRSKRGFEGEWKARGCVGGREGKK